MLKKYFRNHNPHHSLELFKKENEDIMELCLNSWTFRLSKSGCKALLNCDRIDWKKRYKTKFCYSNDKEHLFLPKNAELLQGEWDYGYLADEIQNKYFILPEYRDVLLNYGKKCEISKAVWEFLIENNDEEALLNLLQVRCPYETELYFLAFKKSSKRVARVLAKKWTSYWVQSSAVMDAYKEKFNIFERLFM